MPGFMTSIFTQPKKEAIATDSAIPEEVTCQKLNNHIQSNGQDKISTLNPPRLKGTYIVLRFPETQAILMCTCFLNRLWGARIVFYRAKFGTTV